jgi:hypothetical protein
MNAVIKIETTATRLVLVAVVFGVAFGAASLVEHLLRDFVPTDIQSNGEAMPQWYLQHREPLVYRRLNSLLHPFHLYHGK